MPRAAEHCDVLKETKYHGGAGGASHPFSTDQLANFGHLAGNSNFEISIPKNHFKSISEQFFLIF